MFEPDKTIYAYLTSNLRTWEIRELINWINDSPENKQKFKAIREYWENTGETITLEKVVVDKAFNKLNQMIFVVNDEKDKKEAKIVLRPSAGKTQRIVWLSIAASIALLLGIFFFMGSKEIFTDNQIVISTIVKQNPMGRKSQIFLPDGTKVWLNAESRIEYKETFGKTDRNIILHGEAYFDIEKNEMLPFVVKASEVSVTALGTEFNVRSYSEESSVEVLLTEGKVVVADLDLNNHDISLIEGESLTYSKSNKKFIKNANSFDHLLAWKNGILSFHEAAENEVIRTLERWYGVRIVVTNKQGNKPWKYTSKFENESLENVLTSMGHVKKFDFTIKGEFVTINY